MKESISLKRELKKEEFLIYLTNKYRAPVSVIVKSWFSLQYPNQVSLNDEVRVSLSAMEMEQLKRLF
jgi:hypothetical protein